MYSVRRVEPISASRFLKVSGANTTLNSLLRHRARGFYTTNHHKVTEAESNLPLMDIPTELENILKNPPPELRTSLPRRLLLKLELLVDKRIKELEEVLLKSGVYEDLEGISGLEDCLQYPVIHGPTDSVIFIYGSNHDCKQCPRDIESFFKEQTVDLVCVEGDAGQVEYHRKRIKYLGYKPDEIDLSLLNRDLDFEAGTFGGTPVYLPSGLGHRSGMKSLAVNLRIFHGMDMTTAVAIADQKGIALSRVDVKRECSTSLKERGMSVNTQLHQVQLNWLQASHDISCLAYNKIVYGISQLAVDPKHVREISSWLDAPCPITNLLNEIVFAKEMTILKHQIGLPRDLYMAGYLQRLCFMNPGYCILAVVGSAHKEGIGRFLPRHVPQKLFSLVGDMNTKNMEEFGSTWENKYLDNLSTLTDPDLNTKEIRKIKKDPRQFLPSLY